MDDIDAAMGGRIAEELTFGENKVSTGASSDMKSATNLATWMISNWGFSDKVLCLSPSPIFLYSHSSFVVTVILPFLHSLFSLLFRTLGLSAEVLRQMYKKHKLGVRYRLWDTC